MKIFNADEDEDWHALSIAEDRSISLLQSKDFSVKTFISSFHSNRNWNKVSNNGSS
jgi:hypothetical protein